MNILLTSVGRRSYIVDYFKEAVGIDGKVIATNSSYTNAMSRADAFFISPVIYDEDYIPFMIDVCKRENVDAILSLFDIDLPILAKNKSLFAQVGSRFVGPSYDAAVIGNDKVKTHEFFNSVGVKTPDTYIDCRKVINLVEANFLNFPLIIKPRWGMGSIGVYLANNMDELRVLYVKCSSEIFNSYLKYESVSDIDAAVIIQNFIDGQEYGLDIYKDLSGNYVSSVAKRKIAMRSGETDIGETVDLEPFKFFIDAIAKNMEFAGLLSVDCFLSSEGVYGIEINPRISGHYPFSHIAGVRYPQQVVQWLKGAATDFELFKAKIGVRGCKELTPTIIENR